MVALLLWDCGAALELTAGTKNAANKESIAILFFMVPPLPHARELEGWPVQKRLARAADFAGLLAWRKGTLSGLKRPRKTRKTLSSGAKAHSCRALYAGAEAPALLKRAIFSATYKSSRLQNPKSSLAAFP